jgi:AsmA protein
MKKALLIFSSILVFILLAIQSLPYLFNSKIRTRVEQEINKNVDAIVTFDRIGVSIFRHFPNVTLSLQDLIVQGKGRFSGDTLTSIKEMAIEINLTSLIIGKETEVKSIHLDEPNIDIVVLADGLANYDIAISDTSKATTDSSSTPLSVALDRIIITKGQITYDDRSTNTLLRMNHVDYTGQGDFEKDIFDMTTKMEVEQFTADYGKVRYLNEKHVKVDMIMEMDMTKFKFTFKENNIKINHFGFGMEGSFTMLDKGYDIDLKFATQETKFKNILSLVPGVYMEDLEQVQTNGELAFSGFVKGIYDDTDSLSPLPAFHLDLKVKDGMFKIDTLPAPVNNIQLELVVDNATGIEDSTRINLKAFHMDMGTHPIHGRALIVGLSNPVVDVDIIADVELSELEKMYPIKGLDLKGKLDFELKAKGTYRTENSNKKLLQIPALHLNMQLSNGRIKYDSLPAAIEDIQLQLTADNSTGKLENTVIDFKSIHFNMGKNPVHGYAKVSGYEPYSVDADIKANLDLADIEKMYPIKGLVLKGMFNLDVQAKGIYDQAKKKLPVIDAKMQLTNGFLQTSSYPEPIENIHLIAEAFNSTGNVADTRLNIAKFTYTMEDEPFEVRGSVTNMDTYAYDLKIKGLVDLGKITKVYPVPGYQLTGMIDSDFETRGTLADLEAGKYDKVVSDGSIEVKNVNVKGDDLPQRINIKDALFTFTPAKIIMSRFDGQFGKSHVQITGDLSNYMSFLSTAKNKSLVTADLKLTCDTLDLNEWLANNVSTPSNNKTATTAADTSVHPQISVWEVPKNLDFTFDSDISVVKYEDMFITKMDGEIRIKDGVLSMDETGFNTLNALFSVSGDYDTRDLNHPLFDFKLNIKELDINKAYKELKIMRDLAPAAADAYGIFSIDYSLKGELDQNMSPKTQTLTGGGQVRIADAKVDGMKMFDEISKAAKKQELNDPHLKDVVIDTEVRDNKLYVKPFSMNISGFDMDIEGVNNISGAINYVVKIELFPIDKLKIPCHVTGTYDNPKVILGKGKTDVTK